MSDTPIPNVPADAPPLPNDRGSGGGDSALSMTNGARSLLLGSLMTGRQEAIDGIEDDADRIGVTTGVARITGWGERLEAVAESEGLLADLGIADEVRDVEVTQWRSPGNRPGPPRFTDAREVLWSLVSTNPGDRGAAYAWLRANAAEADPVLVACACAALSHFNRPKQSESFEIPVAHSHASQAIREMVDSSDDVVRQIAEAATGRESSASLRALRNRFSAARGERSPDLSLVVHGTFGYPGTWWAAGGGFHHYIRANVRSNLYDGLDSFSWSGVLKERHRRIAAERLAGWLHEKAGGQVDAAFCHSYGGAVALMSTTHGVRYKTVVLLSVPAKNYEVEWRHVDRAVSLRIHCDLVLLAARARQKFKTNVEEHFLDDWFVSHAASHDETRWTSEKIADWLKL